MTIPNVNPYTGNKPTPGQPQPEFNQNMSDELDYFNSLPNELNPAIDGINATATQVTNDATSAAQSATAAEAAAENSGYAGLWPDTGGSALKGETWQTQVGGAPTGEYFVALKDTSVDPVGDNDNWRMVVTNSAITTAQNDIVGGSIFKGSNGDTVEVGDTVESGVTAIRLHDGVYELTPSVASSGQVLAIAGGYINISGSIHALTVATNRTKLYIFQPDGSDITDYLEKISDSKRVRVHLVFPDGFTYFLDDAYTRFTESIIDLGTCTFRPVTAGDQMWTNAGQRNKWYNGKFEPADYSKNYYGVLWTHDATQTNGSFNEWFNPYFAGVFRAITAYMDSSLGKACYSHAIHNPQITGVGKDRSGSWGVCFNGNQAGNAAGNDSRVVGGRISSSESNLYNIGGTSTRFDKVRSDGGKYAYRLSGSQYNQITGQYTEFNDVLLKLEGTNYGHQMLGGSQASNTVIQDGQQVGNLPVISIGINGISDVLSINARTETGSPGNFVVSAATKLKLGLYSAIDSTIVSSVDLIKIDETTLGLSTQGMSEDIFKLQAEAGNKIAIGGPEGLDVKFDDNGNIDMLPGRRLSGAVKFEERSTLRAASYEGSYILNEGGVYSLICHSNGVRVKFSGIVV